MTAHYFMRCQVLRRPRRKRRAKLTPAGVFWTIYAATVTLALVTAYGSGYVLAVIRHFNP